MAKPQYLVGHDVEVFVTDVTGIVPVCGRVGGTKKEPLALEGSTVGTTYQEDGVALELGMTPCLAQEFYSKIDRCFDEGYRLAAGKGLTITSGSSYTFTEASMSPFPELLILGCSPDQLASARGMTRQPVTAEVLGTTRCTGGHLHFSFAKGGTVTDPRNSNNVPVWAIVDMLDAFALMFYNYHDLNRQGKRAMHYGLPGLYRDKPYGLEYRTPDNTWFFQNDGVVEQFIVNCSKVVQACNELSPTKIHDYYSSINMEQVRTLLDLSIYNSYKARMTLDLTGTAAKLDELRHNMFEELGELRS